MDRLSGDYNRGYTKAIQDIINIIKYIQEDLAYNKKRLTPKLTEELLECCLHNRERLRESIDGFIRYNSKGYFEFYEPGVKNESICN